MEKSNKRQRVSFAQPADIAPPTELLADISEHSDEDSDADSDGAEDSDVSGSSALFDAPMVTHKINEDLFVLNSEIETKEEHIKRMLEHDDPHLIRAKVDIFFLYLIVFYSFILIKLH